MQIIFIVIIAFLGILFISWELLNIKERKKVKDKISKIKWILSLNEEPDTIVYLLALLFENDFRDIEIENKCKYCGCTELRGCSNGCWWINSDENICSNCGHENQEDLE